MEWYWEIFVWIEDIDMQDALISPNLNMAKLWTSSAGKGSKAPGQPPECEIFALIMMKVFKWKYH